MDGVEFIRHVAEGELAGAVIIASALDAKVIHAVRAVGEGYGLQVLGAIEKPLTARRLGELLATYRPRPRAPRSRGGRRRRRRSPARGRGRRWATGASRSTSSRASTWRPGRWPPPTPCRAGTSPAGAGCRRRCSSRCSSASGSSPTSSARALQTRVRATSTGFAAAGLDLDRLGRPRARRASTTPSWPTGRPPSPAPPASTRRASPSRSTSGRCAHRPGRRARRAHPAAGQGLRRRRSTASAPGTRRSSSCAAVPLTEVKLGAAPRDAARPAIRQRAAGPRGADRASAASSASPSSATAATSEDDLRLLLDVGCDRVAGRVHRRRRCPATSSRAGWRRWDPDRLGVGGAG